MEFMITGRRAGKTHFLLKLMQEDSRLVMVTADPQQRDWTYRHTLHHEMGLDKSRFICVSELDNLRGLRDRVALVDNLDMVLSRLLPIQIAIATSTGALLEAPIEELRRRA